MDNNDTNLQDPIVPTPDDKKAGAKDTPTRQYWYEETDGMIPSDGGFSEEDKFLEKVSVSGDVIYFTVRNGDTLQMNVSEIGGFYISDKKTILVEDSITETDKKSIDVNHDGITIKQADDDTTYENGDKVEEDTLYTADAIIEEGFDVIGVTVGNYKPGDRIKGGETVVEVLKKMLTKEVDCGKVLPTVTLAINPNTTPVEVGTSLAETLNVTYTDGKFTGDTASYGKAYSVNAGCAEGVVTYAYNGTTFKTVGANTTNDTRVAIEGDNTWSAKAAYGASTVTPVKNTGAASAQKITAGTTATASKTIVGQYKYFIGYNANLVAANVTATEIRNLNALTGWLTIDGTTTVAGPKSSNGQSIVIACPSKYKLSAIQNGLGMDIMANFTQKCQTVAPIGGTQTATYNVYMYPISNGAKVEFKNIKFTKA